MRADLQNPDAITDELLRGVTHVVHLAANTSFISKEGVWEMNYEGTRLLARRLRTLKTLERFVYVGTAMICGNGATGSVREDSYPATDAEHLVAYTASKAAADVTRPTIFRRATSLARRFGRLPSVSPRRARSRSSGATTR